MSDLTKDEAFAIAEFIGKMNRRTFEEMVSYFNQTVADMDIDREYKMELLGMITAILQRHDEDMKHAREALRKEIWEYGRDRLD